MRKGTDPNKVYNRILDFLGFLMTVFFIVIKLLNLTSLSWWWILVPLFLPGFFHADEEDDYDDYDDDDRNSSNNFYRLV